MNLLSPKLANSSMHLPDARIQSKACTSLTIRPQPGRPVSRGILL